MPVDDGVGRTTRDYLRAGTAQSHDRLDKKLGALIAASKRDYANFLEIQYSARAGIEQWLLAGSDIDCPWQSDLIVRDLAALGRTSRVPTPAFVPPSGADPVGVAWVLAGSSLGNRAMLAQIGKAGLVVPTDFLADRRMTEYWRKLRALLAREHSPVADRPLLIGAQASFDHFNAVVADSLSLEAA